MLEKGKVASGSSALRIGCRRKVYPRIVLPLKQINHVTSARHQTASWHGAKHLRLFSQFKMFAVKTLFAALLFLFMSMFFGVMLLPWLYLPLVTFLYFRPLFKVAFWIYVGLISVTLLQMIVVSSLYPKQYPPDTELYFYGGLPITPLFLYEMQLSPQQNCQSAHEHQPCGYQLSQWIPLSPTANCTLSLDSATAHLLQIRAKAGLCLLTRIPTTAPPAGPSIIVDVKSSIFTLHAAFVFSVAVLLACLLLLNNIRQSYRVPSNKAEK